MDKTQSSPMTHPAKNCNTSAYEKKTSEQLSKSTRYCWGPIMSGRRAIAARSETSADATLLGKPRKIHASWRNAVVDQGNRSNEPSNTFPSRTSCGGRADTRSMKVHAAKKSRDVVVVGFMWWRTKWSITNRKKKMP